MTILSGNITDGAGAAATNSITKTGAGPLVLSGANTYSGYTNINAGTIVVNSDTNISPNSIVTFNNGNLGVWNTSLTTDRNYVLIGAGTFDVGAAKTLTQSINSNISGTTINKSGLGTMVLNGVNSNGGGVAVLNGVLQISAAANLGDGASTIGAILSGGTLRDTGTFSTARTVTMFATGGIDVTSGQTLTITGVVSGAGNLVKTGAGTFNTTGATNTMTTVTVENGTYLITGTNTPFGATAVLNFNGGNFAQTNTTANQTFATTGFAFYGGGGHFTLTSAAGFSSQLTVGNFIRQGAGTGVTSLAKSGTGTLTLATFSVNNPEAGNNTFTGGTTLNQGTLLVQDPRALGTGAVNLVGGTLDLRSNGGGINGIIILGNQAGPGSNVNLLGPVTINVQNVTTNSGNQWQINHLNLSENTLTTSGGNNYGLRVAGTTTIQGSFANVANLSDVSGTLELAGLVTGAGALNKTGGTTNQRVLTISGSANNFSGGTNIGGGMVQVTATSGTPLGAGRVTVFPGGELRIAGNGSLGGAPLQVLSRASALGSVAMDADFNPSVLTSANFSSTYGTLLAISHPFQTTPLNMAAIGDGRAFLGAGIGAVEADYSAPTLGAGAADVGGLPAYRLAGGAGTLALVGPDNALTGNAFLQIGNPLANTGTNQTFGQGAVIIRNSTNFTGGTIDPVVANTPLAAMTLAFGTSEAIIYNSAAATINAQTTGTGGLTKFGPSILNIQSNNPGFTGTVTVNAGTLNLTTMLGANGTSQPSPVNGQPIVMNGGSLGWHRPDQREQRQLEHLEFADDRQCDQRHRRFAARQHHRHLRLRHGQLHRKREPRAERNRRHAHPQRVRQWDERSHRVFRHRLRSCGRGCDCKRNGRHQCARRDARESRQHAGIPRRDAGGQLRDLRHAERRWRWRHIFQRRDPNRSPRPPGVGDRIAK